MSDGRTEISVAYAMLAATKQKGCAECGVALCAHVAEVISVLHKTAPAERAILTDLIADLRDRHTPRDGLCDYCWSCDRCPVPWPCPDSLAADRAEARLREVQGE